MTSWRVCEPPDGEPYYFNVVTKEAAWELPSELIGVTVPPFTVEDEAVAYSDEVPVTDPAPNGDDDDAAGGGPMGIGEVEELTLAPAFVEVPAAVDSPPPMPAPAPAVPPSPPCKIVAGLTIAKPAAPSSLASSTSPPPLARDASSRRRRASVFATDYTPTPDEPPTDLTEPAAAPWDDPPLTAHLCTVTLSTGGKVWEEQHMESVGVDAGQVYYLNVVTNETSWTAPEEAGEEEDTGMDPGTTGVSSVTAIPGCGLRVRPGTCMPSRGGLWAPADKIILHYYYRAPSLCVRCRGRRKRGCRFWTPCQFPGPV